MAFSACVISLNELGHIGGHSTEATAIRGGELSFVPISLGNHPRC
jgi:hypothetical protein